MSSSRMARAVRTWAEGLLEHVELDDGELKQFVCSVESVLGGRSVDKWMTGLDEAGSVGVVMDVMDVGVLRRVFDLYNSDGASMPGWLRVRETMEVLPVLQVGVREFRDELVVWAGPTLDDVRYVVTLERETLQLLERTPENVRKFRSWLQLKFYVFPKRNVVGWVLATGLCEESWGLTIYCLKNIDRLIKPEQDACAWQFGCPVARFPYDLWPAVVLHLNPDAVCVSGGEQFRGRVEDFIRSRAGCEDVFDADFARCTVWDVRKHSGNQLFGVYVDEYGTVHVGAV
jgi:hypothetical protein